MLKASEQNRRFFEQMQQPGLIRNLQTDFILYSQDSVLVPTSVNEAHPDNCWVVSPLTQIIGYAQDELPKIGSVIVRALSRLLIAVLAIPLRLARLDRLQVFNNQCLSTNLYADEWQRVNLCQLRQQALQKYPDHTLMLRSLNDIQNANIIHQAKRDGWRPIVTRQVYLYQDRALWWARHNARMDDRLLQQSGWRFQLLDPDNSAQMARAEQLYNQLYLEKYSRHNVQFSADWLRTFSATGLIELYGLFYQEELLGVAGLYGVDQTITAPVIGYDTERPMRLALYRRLIAFVIRYAMDHQLTLNLSAGSPDFKRRRGGVAAIEYSYVYVRHLGLYRRAVWWLLSWLSQHFYRPLLERFKL
ncbi:GNAT family N-acetyltransferase [Saccharospirillum sp. HFRX-1]|uniref:GNAT family N-acetyltransferase n=1 Tax=unclassified Saccharospirillum TaxID=2633430 RepID=UPI0037153D7B